MGDLLRHSIDLEDRVRWLENGLKEIANGRDDMNGIYIKQQAQATLDGEPTTADEYNDVISQYEDHEIQSDIKKVQSKIKETTTADEYNISEGRRGHGYDYGEFEDENDFDVSPDAPAVLLGTLIPENTVRISDINKEIAKEWNRDREERINKESN